MAAGKLWACKHAGPADAQAESNAVDHVEYVGLGSAHGLGCL